MGLGCEQARAGYTYGTPARRVAGGRLFRNVTQLAQLSRSSGG
ncbi:MAG: hypothetical protein ACRDQ5_24145 [Sciscionella sp.]